jgi:hypothetical protein
MTPTQYILRADKLKSKRLPWESHWQVLAYYCLPLKANIVGEQVPGGLLPPDVYDSTAIHSAQIFASGMYAYMTNPASRWFGLAFADPRLNEAKKGWLREQEDIIYEVLANSNFYQPVHEVYVDLIVFGTANMYAEEDPDDYIRFYSRALAESCIAENVRGIVDTNMRTFKLTAQQAIEKWGIKKVSEEIKRCLESQKQDDSFEFLHVVSPRYERDVSKEDAKNLPWESIYIDKKAKKKMSTGGYHEFPFFVPRFMKRSDSPYGYSNSMVALPDIKMVNSMSYTILKAEEKMVDPPLQGPDDGYILPLDTSAGALNYHRTEMGEKDRFQPLYDTRIHNLDAAMTETASRRESIQRAFFVDLFLMMVNRPKMTATEVVKRVDEKMLILSPMLGRLMKEFLQPSIARTFNVLVRGGVIDIPEELRGKRYDIRYVSPLARAQRAAETRSIAEYVDLIIGMANAKPDVLDTVNFDKVGREVAKLDDIPPSILRDDDEIKVIRDKRKEQEQIPGGESLVTT